MKNKRILTYLKSIHSGYMGNFLGTFYATVLGVFISLICAEWMNEYNDKQDIDESLSAIKSELIENRETAQKLYERIRLEKTGMRYLCKYHDKLDSIPKDSLEEYGSAALTTRTFLFKFDALESMKMSGLFHKLPQRNLSLLISKAYSSVLSIQTKYEEYKDEKDMHANELKKYKEIRDLPSFASYRNWEIYLEYPEGLYYLKELPLMQASKFYRHRMRDIDKAIEALK